MGFWWRVRGPTTPVIDPATEQICAVFAEATTAEIDTAVAAAMRAQRAWWALSALERTEALHEVATALAEVAPLVGEVMTREMGKPFVESNWEGGTSASSLRYYAELARHDQGRVAGAALPGQTHLTLKEPLGTVVSIVPFNFPVLLFGWQAAASLAAGNAVIVKPSELTPMTLLALMEAFSVLPPGFGAGAHRRCRGGGRRSSVTPTPMRLRSRAVSRPPRPLPEPPRSASSRC
jgi:acyl-CoA reductase-like NAD-dependent aldehyde dehydrogenase